jgi:hypothetical protein
MRGMVFSSMPHTAAADASSDTCLTWLKAVREFQCDLADQSSNTVKEIHMHAFARSLLGMGLAAAIGNHAVAATASTWNADFRYRFENVEDDALPLDASASTARLRLGWTQAFDAGLSVLVEGEAVGELNDQFNSGANGETSRPAVLDARALELNRAALTWRGESAGVVLGRQRIVLDNQRFVGNVGWRQNEQTFDALSLDALAGDVVKLSYHWIDRVHRINGDNARDPLARERDLDAHLLHASGSSPLGQLAAYVYLVEDQQVASASARTVGVRWSGRAVRGDATFSTTLEFARQVDYSNQPVDFGHDYTLVEPSLVWNGITFKAGRESLGSDGTHAFQTPLATLHAFNGWADKFVVTPATGLVDRYASTAGTFGAGGWRARAGWSVAWHDFRAARGVADYGREWNAMASLAIGKGWSGMLKLADYRSDDFARDTRKLWIQFEWAR